MGKRRKKRGDKGACQLAHTKRRLLARYGLNVDISEVRALAKKIHKNQPSASGVFPECLGRQSLRLTIWAVSYRGVLLTLVYDSIRHTIVTALPAGTGLPGGAPVKMLDWNRFEKTEEEATV
jgi:hypothetical protein